jgi:hypothetical protein
MQYAAGGVIEAHTPVPLHPIRYTTPPRQSWRVLPEGWKPTPVRAPKEPKKRARVRPKVERGQSWTESHADRVRELYESGESFAAIADRLGKSNTQVRTAFARAGGVTRAREAKPVERKPRPQAWSHPDLVPAYEADPNLTRLADRFGVSRATVRAALLNAGVNMPTRTGSDPVLVECLVREYRAGAGLHELAQAHRLGLKRVRALIIEGGGTIRRHGG